MDAIILVSGLVAIVLLTVLSIAGRYKRCPSDRVLVIYGRVGEEGQSARCLHGGGALVWPILQGHSFLDLTPLSIDIRLEGALSQQNIRVNTPATFTVGISTEPGVMQNAAERLLGLELLAIETLARDIIFGQMRVVIATMPIEEINTDREKLIANITDSLEAELAKVGLRLINVNIQDVTDESGYIDALGQEAAARAINEAKIRVAEQERDGSVGAAEADRERRVRVAEEEATATEGENESRVVVANSESARRQRAAEADRAAIAAERVTTASAEAEAFAAEAEAEEARTIRDRAKQQADVIMPAEVERERARVIAEAEAASISILNGGQAEGNQKLLEAEANGQYAILSKRAEGISDLVGAAGNSPRDAVLLLMAEQMPALVEQQANAISGIDIDKIIVWEGGGGGDANGGLAGFVRSLATTLPPIHDLAASAGIELPAFLGSFPSTDDPVKPEVSTMSDDGESAPSADPGDAGAA